MQYPARAGHDSRDRAGLRRGKGRNVKFTKVAAVAAGTFLAMGVAAPAMADSGAEAIAAGSPGVLSGNILQVPVHIPVNLCGNTVNVIGALNPAFGNTCINK